jgi:hypothetical protein
MSINTVVAYVHLAIRIPFVEIFVRGVHDLGWLFGPNQIFGFLLPKALFVIDRPLVNLVVDWVLEVVAVLVSNVLVFSFLFLSTKYYDLVSKATYHLVVCLCSSKV